MQRSVIVILLAIICGVSAAIGVNRLTPNAVKSNVETRSVYVAATSIRRGAKIKELDIKAVQWPAELVPQGVVTNKEDAVGRSALSGITTDEPLMQSKLSDAKGSGFASNQVPRGMRACTIQTSGPSASVAGFVRPGDKVDVLLNLRGTSRDETGGGSTLTLLQSAEILAIDDIMDVDESTIKMWMKEGVTSVTLLATPEQAMLISLGQSVGTMSLALRNGDDPEFATDTHPVTINQIRNMPAASTFPLQELLKSLASAKADADGAADETAEEDSSDLDSESMVPSTTVASASSLLPPEQLASASQERNRPSFIFTLRGDQAGMVRVLKGGEANP